MAAALGGAPDDDTLTSWRLPADLQQALRTWLGEPPAATEILGPTDTDTDQEEEIIDAAPGARLIVEAGPGSGETRVAIERVRSLINADVSPTRIWMVSFTHAATGEMRNRIAATLKEPRAALEVANLDPGLPRRASTPLRDVRDRGQSPLRCLNRRGSPPA